MRTLLIVTTALLLAAPAAAQRKVNEQFAALPDGHVRVQLMSGSVRVTGWERDSIAIRGVVYETANEKFMLHRDKTGVKLGLWDPTVEKSVPSQLELFVPARSLLWIKTATGSVVVNDVSGGVEIGTSTASVDVSGTPREIIMETMSGPVTIDARSRVARVRTATGLVTLRGTISDADVSTVSGHVVVETSGIDRGRFESVDGDIRYRGDVARLASLDFINHAGAVEINVPATAAAEFNVNNFEGTIDGSALGVTPRRMMMKGKGAQETYIMNGGGAYFTIRSFKGPVVLRRK